MRPIFGEDLVDHLNACKRKIAKPLALSIMSLLDGGLTDEGLFRIPTKQIKLDKVKAFMDTNTPLTHVLQVKYLNYRVSQQVSDSKILILRFSNTKTLFTCQFAPQFQKQTARGKRFNSQQKLPKKVLFHKIDL